MNAIILHTDDRVVVHDKTPYDDKITVKSANQSVDVCQLNDSIRIVGQSGGDGIPYDGPYSVASILFSDISYPTNGRTMSQDITIRKIPYERTSNTSGGYTAIIAN